MNTFARSTSQIFKGALKAFRTFPASIGSALAFAVVTMIRIQLDWPQQEPFNFLFNCLHWAFALGAVFSLTAVTAAQSRSGRPGASLNANLLGAAAAAATFCALYWFGAREIAGSQYAVVSTLAWARVSAAMLVCFLAFIVFAGYPKEQSDFPSAFFMTHKAFFIALLYGAVILAGAFGVARAVQSLLYRDMSEKVYQYIATLAGFTGFTIFLGYFPDFHKGVTDEHRAVAQKQPRFIEILFTYILIPIVLALTVVLLAWAAKTVRSGMNTGFVRLSVIAASYTVGGLWLHAMVTEYDAALAKFYRRAYPFASAVILVFEAWAVLNQLTSSGLKLTEYVFILIWIVAAAGVALLLALKSRAHPAIAGLVCALSAAAVLPGIGYQALPVTAQAARLETLLTGQGMLKDGTLSPAESEPPLEVRESITDAVAYLAGAQDAALPSWFDKKFGESDVFKAKLGFAQTWAQTDNYESSPGQYGGTYLTMPSEAIDISGYAWAVNLQAQDVKGRVTVSGGRGAYTILWTEDPDTGIPELKVLLDDRVILDKELSGYLHAIAAKYPQAGAYTPAPEDMTVPLQCPEADFLLVFGNVQINVDASGDTVRYWVSLNSLYVKENP
jgi:hypothetical protein